MPETKTDDRDGSRSDADSTSTDPGDPVPRVLRRAIQDGTSVRQLANALEVDPDTLARRVGRNATLGELEERLSQGQYRELRRQMRGLLLETIRSLRPRRRADRDADRDGHQRRQADLPTSEDLSTLMKVSREMNEFLDEELSALGKLSDTLEALRDR